MDKLFHFEGREKNVIFDAVVALGVILSFHRIQHWVTHQVDPIFFKRWHEAAKALRHAMDKAAHIADPDLLRQRFVEAVAAFVAGGGCAIYGRIEGSGFELQHGTPPDVPTQLGVDDDAVLEMRTSGTWIYLETLKTAARGHLAFPILVRGRMQGMVVVGAKASGQVYRPDELSLLAVSVQQLGQAGSRGAAGRRLGAPSRRSRLGKAADRIRSAQPAPASPAKVIGGSLTALCGAHLLLAGGAWSEGNEFHSATDELHLVWNEFHPGTHELHSGRNSLDFGWNSLHSEWN